MNGAELFEMFAPDATTAEVAQMDDETVFMHIFEMRQQEPDSINMWSREIAQAILEYARDDIA